MTEYDEDPLTGDPVPKSTKGRKTDDDKFVAVTDDVLAKLGQMTKAQLISLINDIGGAFWGAGIKTKEQREEAILLKLSILALTNNEAKDVVASSKEYFDRTRGRPQQSLDVSGKIGLVQIIMEAKRRELEAPTISSIGTDL